MRNLLLTALAFIVIIFAAVWFSLKCLFTWRNPRKEFDEFIDTLIED